MNNENKSKIISGLYGMGLGAALVASIVSCKLSMDKASAPVNTTAIEQSMDETRIPVSTININITADKENVEKEEVKVTEEKTKESNASLESSDIKPYKVEQSNEDGKYIVTTYTISAAKKKEVIEYNADGTIAKGETYYVAPEGTVLVGDKYAVENTKYIVSENENGYKVEICIPEFYSQSVAAKAITKDNGETYYVAPEGFKLYGDRAVREEKSYRYISVDDVETYNYVTGLVKEYSKGYISEEENTLKRSK